MNDRIDELASTSGATRAAPLRQSEVVAFEIREDGSVRFTQASGAVTHSLSLADWTRLVESAERSRLSPADIAKLRRHLHDMRVLFRELERLAPDAQFSVPVYRREIIKPNGQRAVAFVEAGR